MWASLIARMNALLPAGKRQRFLTPLLYQVAANGRTVGQNGCVDITIGQNASHPRPGVGYDATAGFDAVTGSLFKLGIHGRDGISLQEHWREGPRTYLGLATRGFPNLFMITGPQSPSVLSNMVVSIEQHVDWITNCLRHMRERGVDVVEPLPDAEMHWVTHHNEVANATLVPTTNSWWVGSNVPGKLRRIYPYLGGVGNYRAVCEQVAARDYDGFHMSVHDAAAVAGTTVHCP